MSNCGQACPYNTLNGCKVKEYNGTCPLTNMALADFEAVKDAKPQTNADRIRAMSDEELAKLLLSADQGNFTVDICSDAFCVTEEKDCPHDCTSAALNWLKQPVKDGEDDGRT